MILWTMQPIEVWNIIQNTGMYRCDPAKSSMQEMEFVEKYEWLKWALRAFQSVYGYEYQGDNLLIARINILMTFVEYLDYRW